MAIKIAGTEVISDDKRILNNESLPDIRPSLLLDFANSKTLDPRITFTRGSTASYWDGKTTAKAEENLTTYSQDFSEWNAQGGAVGGVTDNNATAPDGTNTAAKIENVSGSTQDTKVVSDISITTDYITFSCYAKEGTTNYLMLFIGGASLGATAAWFNLTTGSTGTTQANVASSSMTDVGNGWYRCVVTTTDVSSLGKATTLNVECSSADNTSTADAGDSIYAWGAQLEQRSSATAYTPTTSSPIVKYQPVLQTAASGEARFDHDPVTGESKGLLIEEARTNLFPYDNPSASAWYKNSSTVTANATTAPDGTTTASKLVENTATAVHYTSETITVSGDTTYTMSVFAKAGERGYLKLQCGFVSNWVLAHDIVFDLSDGSLHHSSSAQSIEGTHFGSYDMGNGWYRLWISGTTISSATAAGFNLHLATGVDGTVTYTGNGYSGVYVWGAQFEAGSFPTSYIPTSGSTVTRSGDLPIMSGSNFTDWFNSIPFSGYVEYDLQTSAINQRIFSIDTNGYDPRLVAIGSTSSGYGPSVELYADGNFYATLNSDATTPTETGTHKMAFAFADNDAANSKDGTTVVTDTSFVFPSNFSQLRIGSQANGANLMQGTIKKIAFYPKRLPNATLQAMTEE